MSTTQGPVDFDREVLLDSLVAAVPLSIIVLLTGLFVVFNPWGWEEPLLIVVVFGLHLVPLITLAPAMYLLVRVVVEATHGESETADRVSRWFSLADDGGSTATGEGTSTDDG